MPFMDLRKFALASSAYVFVTFPIAAIWHLVVMKDLYTRFGYFDGEPNLALGFLSILMQGLLLSLLFPMVRLTGSTIKRGLKFALIIGLFFWTSHVLAFVAKQSIPSAMLFVAVESVYLTLQFGAFGILLGLIHHNTAHCDPN